MATLSLRDFTTLVQTQAAAVQTSSRALVDLTVGSVIRAILEANASVALWFQWLIIQVMALTRAATSNGSDLDTWVADFGLLRQPAIPSTGLVMFSRFTANQVALIVPGSSVKTADGTQSFLVTTDTTNAAWAPSLGGYLIGATTLSLTVPVQAVNAGIQGNVVAGAISLLTTAIPGIDIVTNAAVFTNGIDAESDIALRARFVNFLASRARATPTAIGYAVQSVQQGLSYTIAENALPDGTYRPGTFTVTIDDGSGAPSIALKSAVTAAIAMYRPIGSSYTVQSPTLLTANVAFILVAAPGYSHGNLIGPAAVAVSAYINALPLGAALPITKLAQVIYETGPGVANVTSLLVNGSATDLGGAPSQVVRVGSVVVS